MSGALTVASIYYLARSIAADENGDVPDLALASLRRTHGWEAIVASAIEHFDPASTVDNALAILREGMTRGLMRCDADRWGWLPAICFYANAPQREQEDAIERMAASFCRPFSDDERRSMEALLDALARPAEHATIEPVPWQRALWAFSVLGELVGGDETVVCECAFGVLNEITTYRTDIAP